MEIPAKKEYFYSPKEIPQNRTSNAIIFHVQSRELYKIPARLLPGFQANIDVNFSMIHALILVLFKITLEGPRQIHLPDFLPGRTNSLYHITVNYEFGIGACRNFADTELFPVRLG